MTEKVGDVGTFDQKLKQLEDKQFVDLSTRTTAKSSLRPSIWEARSRSGDAQAPKAEVNAVMEIIENLLHGVSVLPDMVESRRKLTPPLPAVVTFPKNCPLAGIIYENERLSGSRIPQM